VATPCLKKQNYLGVARKRGVGSYLMATVSIWDDGKVQESVVTVT
jgi:hypothetical protein